MTNHFSKEQALHAYRNAWKDGVDAKYYADDIEFYAPMKVFKGKETVIAALENFFSLFNNVTDCSYLVTQNLGTVVSKVFLNNTGSKIYDYWEYDYFQFNENNQIKLYRPIFDTGAATHDLLGFEIAARCAQARKLADSH